MKSFLYKILLFIIPLLVVIVVCEIYIRNRPSIYEKKRDQLIANADSIEILILGDSQPTYGINPNQFTFYAHNMAFEDQFSYFDRKLLEKYLPILPNLKYVFLGIDYGNLCFEHSKEIDSRDFFYKYYHDIEYKNYNAYEYYKKYFLQSFFVYTPEKSVALIRLDIKLKNKLDFEEKGWLNRVTSNPEAVTSEGKCRMVTEKFNTSIDKYEENSADVMGNFEAIISMLQARNIVPILISCPNYSTFVRLLDKKIWEKEASVTNYLMEKYGVIYLDYSKDDSFVVSDYYDCNHLNALGANVLTQRLDSVVMKIESENAEKKVLY